MTPEERKASRAICEAATEGPWEDNGYSRIFSIPKFEALSDGMPDYPQKPRPIHRKENPAKAFDEEDQAWWDQHEAAYKSDPDIACVPAIAGDTAMYNHRNDLVFIAHAREALPAALDEIETREGMCDQKDARIAWLEKCEKEKDARIAELESDIQTNGDVLAMLYGTLEKFDCLHGPGKGRATPPMFFPEWICCIVEKRDARIAELEARVKELEGRPYYELPVKELDAKDRQLAENATYIAQLEEAAVELIGEKELES